MLSDIGIKPPIEMTDAELRGLLEHYRDGWGHIRSKCKTVEDKLEMMAWASKVASTYLVRNPERRASELVRFWLMDMIPNLVQALVLSFPQEVLKKQVVE